MRQPNVPTLFDPSSYKRQKLQGEWTRVLNLPQKKKKYKAGIELSSLQTTLGFY